MSVVVYTQPSCTACEQTKRYLDTKGVPYEVVDITADDNDGYEFVTSAGFRSVPVVKTDDDMWSGFRLEKLNKLVEDYNNK